MGYSQGRLSHVYSHFRCGPRARECSFDGLHNNSERGEAERMGKGGGGDGEEVNKGEGRGGG